MALPLGPQAHWVFVGDSITDASRFGCREDLGQGYVRLVRDWLYARDPASAPTVINVGISGNKISDLQKRWKDDVLARQPSLVSIKIGVNDVWHSVTPGLEGTTLEKFREGYTDILDQVRKEFPEARLVLCEPSVIVPPAPDCNELLQPYVAVVGELAETFDAVLVPMHRAFLNAMASRPDIAWAPDGVHPESAGHMLLARTWLAALGLL